MTTLRQHLNAIRDRNAGYSGAFWQARIDSHADACAALEILDAAETCQLPSLPPAAARAGLPVPAMRHRLLPDPEQS